MGRVVIIIVNWNGWQDTLECLESVFRNDYPDYQVVICDNASADNSVEKIRQWARGETVLEVAGDNLLGHLSSPPILKPVPFVEYDQITAEKGGWDSPDTPLVLVRCSDNLGFAGGNNVALRYMQARDEFQYAWLLNNDTVIDPGALVELVQCIESESNVGMCGSLLPYYDNPDTIWAQGGGSFNRWLAQSRCLGNNLKLDAALSRREVEKRMAYVAGASLLVTKKFIEEVGLLYEEYFLYFEEPDWAIRAQGHFEMAYATDSVVFHKVGRSTSSIFKHSDRDTSAFDYFCRNAFKFTRRFFPVAFPSVFLWVGGKWLVHKSISIIRNMVGVP